MNPHGGCPPTDFKSVSRQDLRADSFSSSSRGLSSSAVVPSARSIHREAAGQVAINTVLHDELRPSHIMLPVIDR